MIGRITRYVLLAQILFSFSCSNNLNGSDSSTAAQETGVVNFSDLIEEDYLTSIAQIEKAQDADDESMDIEDQKELMSQKDKILIVGDSWATFPCVYNSLGKMISEVKANIIEDNRCLRTSKIGMLGKHWIGSKQDQRVIKYLISTTKIKYIYLSLGGNDMLAAWHKDFTKEQEFEIYYNATETLKTIINRYLTMRPDIKIILSGYDYPNFTADNKIDLFKKIYKKMGEPSPERLNPALVDFSQYVARLADGKSVFYVQHLGLSQYYYGNSLYGLSPLKTLSPDQISPMSDPTVVGGIVTMPSSKKSMTKWLYIDYDAFHLNSKMYKNLMRHTYDNVLSHVISNQRDNAVKQASVK